MEALRKKRAAARGWATRAVNKLSTACGNTDTSEVELEQLTADLDMRIQNLDEAQSELESEIDFGELDSDINDAADFRDKVMEARITALKTLAQSHSHLPLGNTSEVASNASHVEAKLPKLELPTFDGDVTLFSNFWDQFSVAVDNADLPDVTKFTYLMSVLHGEAKASVQGLALSSANYKTACEILKKRFGRPDRIIFAHVQHLMALSIDDHPDLSTLWRFYDKLQGHVRSLESLGITGEGYGVILTPLILSKLPTDLRMEWARDGEEHERDLGYLLTFLEKELQRRERSQINMHSECSTPLPTALAFHTTASSGCRKGDSSGSSQNSKSTCGLCKRTNHTLASCFHLSKLTVDKRRDKLKSLNACFRCLSTSKGHDYRRCAGRCSMCHGRHHVLLCFPKQERGAVSDTEAPDSTHSQTHAKSYVTTVTDSNEQESAVLLQTLKVSVKGKNGKVTQANVLFDTGSDRSYVSSSLIEKVGPEWVGSQNLAYACFGNKMSQPEMRNIYNVHLQGVGSKMADTACSLMLTEIPAICVPVHQPRIPTSLLSPDFQFLSVSNEQKVEIDILVGLDAYWKLMSGEIRFLTGDLVAQRSILGWVLSGKLAGEGLQSKLGVSSHQLLCFETLDTTVKSMWDIEAIGISSKSQVHDAVDPVLEKFSSTVKFEGNRYEVSLPWRDEAAKQALQSNEKHALARLRSLNKRLEQTQELQAGYHAVFKDMLEQGIIEEVEDQTDVSGPVFYLPHRPVIKESSSSTKIRPVFDASAKASNGLSLNDCMLTGPSLVPDLPGILLRFRRFQVALTADITKAFLQVKVAPEDQDAHRFFWNDNGTIRKMKFVRVPFGNKSSPFLLNATIGHHLSKYPPSRVKEELSDNLYIDDWLSGCDEENMACDMVKEAHKIMSDAGMTFAKWRSNSALVGELVCQDFGEKQVDSEAHKILGLQWHPAEDCFRFEGMGVSSDLVLTKRVVLSLIARLFDPLGFLLPFTMAAKCLFQQIWRLGLHWDQMLPENLQAILSEWVKGLKTLRDWRIPRCYSAMAWSTMSVFQLHAFGDASESGYGCCLYLVVQQSDGTWSSNLVIARARVAPLKRISLPRLELLGALLCARLLVYVREALKLPESCEAHCWTDSAVVLAWIQSDPYRWKPFVGNRVAEIQALISPMCWSHCPGKDNPADLVTRGISAGEMMKSKLWLHGPSFLTTVTLSKAIELGESSPPLELCNTELKSKAVDLQNSLIAVALSEGAEVGSDVSDVHLSETHRVLDVTRFSDWLHLMRVMAYVMRFIHNLRVPFSEQNRGDLTYEELSGAKRNLLRQEQMQAYNKEFQELKKKSQVDRLSQIAKLSPMLGEDGLLRIKGRLQFAGLPLESEHPIIVPKGHFGKLLASFVHSTKKHIGVNGMLVELRNQYWIVGARRLCKAVKKECLMCQRLDAPAGSQIMAPLPELRVKQAPPFSVTGLDHGGPLYCSDFPGKKFYILLFTCAVIRAVHLELVNSLSAENTVIALRRFFARRGMPSVIMSDNATSFKAARDQLLKTLGPESPSWKFNAPRAPWWGGWWERLIASVKSALKRSVGRRALTRLELETYLMEIEAVVNSRPLTFTGDEIDSSYPLTPAHFLLGRSSGQKVTLNASDVEMSGQEMVERQQFQSELLDKFWFSWLNEYVKCLPLCNLGSRTNGVQLGSVVLIHDDNQPRLIWPMGVVTSVFPGKDGLVRTVEVRTPKGVYIRPVQKIHNLEMTSRDNNDDLLPVTTKSGRKVQMPRRLDL